MAWVRERAACATEARHRAEERPTSGEGRHRSTSVRPVLVVWHAYDVARSRRILSLALRLPPRSNHYDYQYLMQAGSIMRGACRGNFAAS